MTTDRIYQHTALATIIMVTLIKSLHCVKAVSYRPGVLSGISLAFSWPCGVSEGVHCLWGDRAPGGDLQACDFAFNCWSQSVYTYHSFVGASFLCALLGGWLV